MRAILRKMRDKVIFPFPHFVFYKIFSRTKARERERMFFIDILNEPCQGHWLNTHSIDILIGTN